MKIEKILFYLLIFCLPFEARKILWQSGQTFNEWQAVFLYGTDVLLGLVLIFWIMRGGLKKIKIDKITFLFIFLFTAAGLSLIKAQSASIGFYQWAKLLEFILFFFYIRENINLLFGLKRIFQVLAVSALFQSVIAILQFAQQASLGLKILGESPLAPNLAGVAKFISGGIKFIRVYGTFPHPNILAAFLVLALFGLVHLFGARERSSPLFLILNSLLLFAFFLTFSRTIIVVNLLALLFYLLFIVRKKSLMIFFVISCLLLVVLFWPLLSVRFTTDLVGTQAVDLRILYNRVAWQMFKSSPLVGIGWAGFTHHPLLTVHHLELWAYQPAHNIYLLVFSQAGVLGILGFLGLLGVVIKRAAAYFREARDKEILILFFVLGFFLITGLFDHFLLTSQQGALMLWLVLGMLAGYDRNKRP